MVDFLALSMFSNQRMVLMSKLLVGSSNRRISGSAKSACANRTLSFHPGATALIKPSCCSNGIPTPASNSPARDSNPEATDDDYMRAAELEGVYAEFDGYTAESRAAYTPSNSAARM